MRMKVGCFDHESSYWCFCQNCLLEIISFIIFFLFCGLKVSADSKKVSRYRVLRLQSNRRTPSSRLQSFDSEESLDNDESLGNEESLSNEEQVISCGYKANVRFMYYPTITTTLLAIVSTFSTLNRMFHFSYWFSFFSFIFSFLSIFLFFFSSYFSFFSFNFSFLKFHFNENFIRFSICLQTNPFLIFQFLFFLLFF